MSILVRDFCRTYVSISVGYISKRGNSGSFKKGYWARNLVSVFPPSSVSEDVYGILGLEGPYRTYIWPVVFWFCPTTLEELRGLHWGDGGAWVGFWALCLQPEQHPFYLAHRQCWNYAKYFVLRMSSGCGWCGSVVECWPVNPRVICSIHSLGHMPRLWAMSPVGGTWEATTHWCFSPSLSPSLPVSKK